jgi:hypothetical protein
VAGKAYMDAMKASRRAPVLPSSHRSCMLLQHAAHTLVLIHDQLRQRPKARMIFVADDSTVTAPLRQGVS